MTQESPSEFLLTVSGIQHRVPRRTLSPHTATAYWAYNPFRVLLASARIPKPLHPAGSLLGLPTGCGPSPCGRLSRPPTVESKVVGRSSPPTVRSIKRLVQFSRKPLSSAAPPWSHRGTRSGITCVSRTSPNSPVNRRVGYVRHIGFRQRFARNE